MISFLSVALFALGFSSAPAVHAFLVQFKPVVALPDIASAQQGLKLDARLDVGSEKASHLFLDGMAFELLSEKDSSNKVKMPGAHSLHPQVSSGARKVHVHAKPSFVAMTGRQCVDFNDGCWEIVWRNISPSGSLICGFNVAEEARRNDATLPPGCIYMTFPIWTHEALAEQQARKLETEGLVRVFLEKRDDELQRMQETNNIFMKAVHYRNAAEAVEQYSLTGFSFLQKIPKNDEVIRLKDGFLLSSKGTVWTKNKFNHKKVRLGDVFICPSPMN